MSDKTELTYSAVGVDYKSLDPLKKLAQHQAGKTSGNLERFGVREVSASRGESAYVWEEKDSYRAFVIEGLGTKNLVADEVRKITKETYYDVMAQDTVAMIVNDLIVVGAQPQVVNAYFAVGSSDWFADEKRAEDLVNGWAAACNLAGAVWGGGETPVLSNIINPGMIDLSGAAVGIIKPKKNLILGEKLMAGDAIFLIESSGIHANGLTLARAVASKLPDGYRTLLPDGKTYGESLVIPTNIYAQLIRDFFKAGIDIHYMVNITGHGWRKLMRANKELSYVMDKIPEPQNIFKFIQKISGNNDREMYGNFNMGAGFAVFMPKKDVPRAKKITGEKYNWWGEQAGVVEAGPKRVLIKPKNIVYKSKELEIRG